MEGTSEHLSSPTEEETRRAAAPVKKVNAGQEQGLPDGTPPAGTPNRRPGKSKAEAAIKPAQQVIPPREPVEINLRTLLQAGVHFGHQTSRWSPAMAPYIHSSRNGIHIIHLPRTVQSWEQARKRIIEVASRGGSILFVGTKKQAQDPVVEEARRCGAFYVSRRWLGGMITNFQTIRKSIDRLQKLERVLEEEQAQSLKGESTRFTKKERLMMSRERDKLEYSLGGIRTMMRAPQLMFVIDVRREEIAIREAQRLDIPVIALVDTNCDPRIVTHAIPSNDDGTRAIRLFCSAVADAVMEGRKTFESRRAAVPTAAEIVEAAEAKTVVDAPAAPEAGAAAVSEDVLARWGLSVDPDEEDNGRGRR